jgi:hypothetical protein
MTWNNEKKTIFTLGVALNYKENISFDILFLIYQFSKNFTNQCVQYHKLCKLATYITTLIIPSKPKLRFKTTNH